MALLQDMADKDPGMVVKFRVDDNGMLTSILWVTGRNRADYAIFGDAITFDTTYRTNLYSLPFGIFVGVNNHFQSIVFGGVLLISEKAEDFEWAFRCFLEVMGGVAPSTMLTGKLIFNNQKIQIVLHYARKVAHNTVAFYQSLTMVVLARMSIRLGMEFLVFNF